MEQRIFPIYKYHKSTFELMKKRCETFLFSTIFKLSEVFEVFEIGNNFILT